MLWYLCYFAMDKMKALRLCRHMFVSVPAAAANTLLEAKRLVGQLKVGASKDEGPGTLAALKAFEALAPAQEALGIFRELNAWAPVSLCRFRLVMSCGLGLLRSVTRTRWASRKRCDACSASSRAKEHPRTPCLHCNEDAYRGYFMSGNSYQISYPARPMLIAQLARGEVKPDEALTKVKEEAAKVKRTARDGRRAEAAMQVTLAAVQLAKAEPVKAVLAAADAEAYFQREEDYPALADVLLEVVAPAHLQRGDGQKAMDAANLVLDVAQKVKDPEVEARAWGLVAAGRFAASAEDATEAARKALDLFRKLGSRVGEAQMLIELARGHELAEGQKCEDALAALASAREALKVAREAGSWAQAGKASEAIVEAQLQAGQPQAAYEEAEEQLKWISEVTPDHSSKKGLASAMSAVVVATAVFKGGDAGLEVVKSYAGRPERPGTTSWFVPHCSQLLCTASPVFVCP
eukprot:s129_g26.t1